jgi:hypothetical protein
MTPKSLSARFSASPGPEGPTELLEFGRTRTAVLAVLSIMAAATLPFSVERTAALPVPSTSVTVPLPPAALPYSARVEQLAPPDLIAAPSPMIERLASFLARRYRVSQDATEGMVETAYAEANRLGLDPLLVIAVISVESRFNPIAESVAGGKGLMQIIPRYHKDKFADKAASMDEEKAALDPDTNIQVGASILKDYIRRGGGLIAGLQLYNGSPDDPEASYANKVISEKNRLKQIAAKEKPAA